MKYKDGHFSKIDIGDFVGIANPKSINDFYLSQSVLEDKFFEPGTSYIFNGFSINLCFGGHCSLRMNGRGYAISSGSVLIFSSSQLIEVLSVSEDFSIKSIFVSQDVVLEFPSPVDINIINMSLRTPVMEVGEDRISHLLEYYCFLEKQYVETDNAYREEISKALLYALTLEICDIFRAETGDAEDVRKPRQEILTDEFFKLLTKHYRTEHNVSFYADKLNRTPKYLSAAIKRLSGRSVPDWIDTALVSQIKLMLKVTDMTILEISEELNFSSPSVFVQFFRHRTGITPLQYRKQP